MADPTQQITMVQGINLALQEAMANDDRVFMLGEDIADEEGGGVFHATKGLSTQFGKSRVRSTPISEQVIAGAAIGASLGGYRPVAEIMLMNFMTIAMDQIVNHAAKLRFMSGGQTSVPITVRTATGSGMGNGGQHSDMLEAWFCHTAGLKVVAPSNPADAKGLLLEAIMDDDPVVFVECIPLYAKKGLAPPRGHRVPLGKASITREGTDVTLIGYSRSAIDCLCIAEELKQHGISAEVVDLRTLAPLDTDTVLRSVAKTKRAVIVHEAVKPFGLGAELSSVIHENLFSELHAPVERFGSSFCPVPFSKPLEAAYMYRQDAIIQSILKMR